MQAGQDEAPESPGLHGEHGTSDSSPGSARDVFGSLNDMGLTPLARTGASIASPSARKAQAFLAQRARSHHQHKPPMAEGEMLDLQQWVDRNANAPGDNTLGHTMTERAFATGSLRAAMGVDTAMLHGAIPRVPDKVISEEKAFLMAKTLRGATCAPPQPDDELVARTAHKTALYTQPLTVQEPKPIVLTPREVEQKGYPPMMSHKIEATGDLSDARYGVAPDEATRSMVHQERLRQMEKSKQRQDAHSQKDHFAAQALMRGGGGGAPGPVPSPMLLPSPSAPILAASLAAPNSFVAPNLSVTSDG